MDCQGLIGPLDTAALARRPIEPFRAGKVRFFLRERLDAMISEHKSFAYGRQGLTIGAAGCTLTVGTAGRGLVGAAGCTLTVGAAGRGLVGAGGVLGLCPRGSGFALAVRATRSPQLNEFIYFLQMNS